MAPGNQKKRQRVSSVTRVSSTSGLVESSYESPTECSKLRRTSSSATIATEVPAAASFNDPTTADVVLRLFMVPSPLESIATAEEDYQSGVQIYLHSHVLRRSKYFAALLSDRWQGRKSDNSSLSSCTDTSDYTQLNLRVCSYHGTIATHLAVLELLYTNDLDASIDSPSAALDILPVALELLFDDCLKYCIRFLEAVPWSEEEEERVLSLIPFLGEEESRELLARVSPSSGDSSEEMLHGLIITAINNQNMAYVKAFVAKLMKDFSSRESARRVLERAFETSLKALKECMEEYCSPDFRGDHMEMEAIQRLKLHRGLSNGKHLMWLVERMIELRVADSAVKVWSEQAAFTANLQRVIQDEMWANIVPSLPAVLLRCTCKLATAVASGTILAARQVRVNFVKDWVPVLITCKENPPIMPTNKSLHLELEEEFLKIISTLPMTDAQELLQQCLRFTTRHVEDCPHLVKAFNTWFRRATRAPQLDSLG